MCGNEHAQLWIAWDEVLLWGLKRFPRLIFKTAQLALFGDLALMVIDVVVNRGESNKGSQPQNNQKR